MRLRVNAGEGKIALYTTDGIGRTILYHLSTGIEVEGIRHPSRNGPEIPVDCSWSTVKYRGRDFYALTEFLDVIDEK